MPQAWHTPDVAEGLGGRMYSDKAPGTAALALPAFWAAAKALQASGRDIESERGWLVTSWAACTFSQALPAAIGAALLFGWLRRFVSERTALVTVGALWLGGMPLPYSTMLFSHAQVIGLIAVAIWAMDLFQRTEDGGEESGDRCQRAEDKG